MALATDPTIASATPEQIPLFPLGLVLFPGARLPLRIFELHYVEMTKACLRDNSVFGVCLIRHGSEVGVPATHEFIGCSASILSWDMPHPGLFELDCAGESPFRVRDTHIEKTGLIVGNVEWLDQPPGHIDRQHFDPCRAALQRLIERGGEQFFAGRADLDNPEWVSHRLAQVLPVDAQIKQRLLEQTSTALRLAELARLLQSG